MTHKKMLQQYGVDVCSPRTGLGFEPSEPVKITVRRRTSTTSSQYITSMEVEEKESVKPQRHYVFDILSSSKSKTRHSVFDRLSTSKDASKEEVKAPKQPQKALSLRDKPSVFNRMGATSSIHKSQRQSVFSRLNKRQTMPKETMLSRVHSI